MYASRRAVASRVVIADPIQMLLDSLADGSIKLSQAHLIVVSDAQRVVPMLSPHPVIRLMSDFHSKTPDAPRVFATLQSSASRWASLDLTKLEGILQARSFFIAPTQKPDTWYGPMELVIEYEPYGPLKTEPDVSEEVRRSDSAGTSFRPHHYRRASRVFLQLGSYAAYLYWRSVITHSITQTGVGESSIEASLENLKSWSMSGKLDVDVASETYNVTPKLVKCIQMLELCEKYGAAFRGVVYGRFSAEEVVVENELTYVPFSPGPECRSCPGGFTCDSTIFPKARRSMRVIVARRQEWGECAAPSPIFTTSSYVCNRKRLCKVSRLARTTY